MRLFSNATTCCTNHQRIDFIKESIVAPNNYEETGHVSFVAPNSKKNYSADFYFHGFQVPSKMLLQGFYSGRVPLSSRTSPMLLGFFPLFFFLFQSPFFNYFLKILLQLSRVCWVQGLHLAAFKKKKFCTNLFRLNRASSDGFSQVRNFRQIFLRGVSVRTTDRTKICREFRPEFNFPNTVLQTDGTR